MKLLRTVCVLGLALCLATSVYAGTQSVKISGDITIRGFMRDDFDLDHDHSEGAPGPFDVVEVPDDNPNFFAPIVAARWQKPKGTSDWETYFMTTTELQVDADLTDNVSAVIRLFNQRDWNTALEERGTLGGPVQANKKDFNAAGEFDIGVDLAYIELKEFLYSPLTLKIGRQDIWFGKGFIVGANRRNPEINLNAKEYTTANAFDAIRGTLDYDPWTIDVIAAKIWENQVGSKDDEDLWGVNVGYVFDVYNAEAEGYWFWKDDAGSRPALKVKEHNTVHTIGLRGSADPIENWTVGAEGAYQFGEYVGFRQQAERRHRSAWAVDVTGECRHFKEMFAWKPVIGAEYIYYSGDNHESPTPDTTGTYRAWDSMYRGKYDSKIREWFGTYYWSGMGYNTLLERPGARGTIGEYNPELSSTNQHQFIVMGSVQPTDSLTLDARYLAFWQAERQWYDIEGRQAVGQWGDPLGWSKQPSYIGSEVDLELVWDYTEDVSFGLLAAWFFPGNMYDDSGSQDTATDIVATCKLSF